MNYVVFVAYLLYPLTSLTSAFSTNQMGIEILTTLHVPHYYCIWCVSVCTIWPSTCLFRMDHHVAPDIRHYQASAVPPLSEADTYNNEAVSALRSGPFRSSMSENLNSSISTLVRTSITRAQSPDRLDQEVTSFESLRPSFKVRQILDMETWMHGLRPFQTELYFPC
jgi:hypothetical protein